MTQQNSSAKIPENWVQTKLIDIAEINPRVSKDRFEPDMEVSFLPMKAVEAGTGNFDLSLTKKFSGVRKGYTYFIDGDIIFAKITPCMENGKVAIVKNLKNGIGFGSTEFHVVRSRIENDCFRKFIFYYLLQEYFRRGARNKMKGTAGQLRVPRKFMEETLIPFPPLSEQCRIILKVEELLTHLDSGIDSINNVKVKLHLYRQAVLKYAFNGKLTEEWRKTPTSNELESTNLEKIREEKNKNKRKKYQKYLPIGNDDLPELPKNWMWIRLNDVSLKITDGTHFTPTYVEAGVPFISVKNVFDHKISFDKCKYITLDEHNKLVQRCNPEYLDVLITKSGTIGRTCVIKTTKPFSLFVSVALIKPFKKFIDSHFMAFSLENYINSIDINQSIKGGVIKNLHIEDLRKIIIALPPLAEQLRIVEEIENKFSIADETEHIMSECMLQSNTLRQSILKTAFEGNLIAQEIDDNSAKMLIELIKKRENQNNQKKPKKNSNRRSNVNVK